MLGKACLVEVIVGKLFAGMSALNAGAVDQNANLVPVGHHLWRQSLDLLLRCHVGDIDPCFAAQLLNLLLCGLVAGVALPVISV